MHMPFDLKKKIESQGTWDIRACVCVVVVCVCVNMGSKLPENVYGTIAESIKSDRIPSDSSY